ncbi:ADP-ribosyl cyclase/cyclic ADP-ribose hydrolase isoform X1 [Lingula anatina]|uniref:ADP-ribosyl cyclase/cyclic ADP-ribose hydrolase isoform X1 n=1 Tax=Lingula anatina TaxID=7574 RepID=A0A1S3HBL6_LINAN|nr:ADP-ribosyl cyclase/cyclic ADP-ribose hydrolase isoform X1 [Lingula anatina]|eukprot:XP_013383422.1 ADP-ribosyl cyclase/cyclic ADP-ribose hydrolase isoform X1 [Lingula anatina]
MIIDAPLKLTLLLSSLYFVTSQRTADRDVSITIDVSLDYDVSSPNNVTLDIAKSIFSGRGQQYQYVQHPELFKDGLKNVTDLWVKFIAAFQYQTPCTVDPSNFSDFVNAAAHDIPKDKTLLWSKTRTLANTYSQSGGRYFTITDSLSGYLVNDLDFCAQKQDPGVNFRSCPPPSHNCQKGTELSFWREASRKFAELASGTVHVLLNGSTIAYSNESIFYGYELPSLRKEVTVVHALVVHDLGVRGREKCGSGTLVKLRADVEKRGFKFQCTDDPEDLRHLLCADEPATSSCRFLDNDHTSSGNQIQNVFKASAVRVVLIYFFLLAFC